MKDDVLRQAQIAATRQRARLQQRAAATRQRLAPGTLYFNARTAAEKQVTRTAGTAVDAIKQHPLAAGAAVAAALAWLFREPIAEHVLPVIDRTLDDAMAALQDAARQTGKSE